MFKMFMFLKLQVCVKEFLIILKIAYKNSIIYKNNSKIKTCFIKKVQMVCILPETVFRRK